MSDMFQGRQIPGLLEGRKKERGKGRVLEGEKADSTES
jgi:hypothetical protein